MRLFDYKNKIFYLNKMKKILIVLLLILIFLMSFIEVRPKHAVMPYCWFDKENPCHFKKGIEKYTGFDINPKPGLIDDSIEGITTSDQYNKIQKIKKDTTQNLIDINKSKTGLTQIDGNITKLNKEIDDLRIIRDKQVKDLNKLKQYYNN
jgi:hypothetical protein